METLQWTEILSLAVAKKGKPAVYVNDGLDDENVADAVRCAWLRDALWQWEKEHNVAPGEMNLVILANQLLVFFDSVEEQRSFYKIFSGSELDHSRCYAATFDATGVCTDENT